MKYIIGIDNAKTYSGIVVINEAGELLNHWVVHNPAKGDYKGTVALIMKQVGKRLPAVVQAEQVYRGPNFRTYKLLLQLLTRLEAMCESHPKIIWLEPVRPHAITSYFNLETIMETYITEGKSKREARKEAIKDKVEEVWGVRLGDHEADAALHALYALRTADWS